MLIHEDIAAYGAAGKTDADLLRALGFRPEPDETLEGFRLRMHGGVALARLEALLEISRRLTRTRNRQKLTSPREAGTYLLTRCAGWTEEKFGLLALNARGALLADRILSMGTATGTLISPREFFREALRLGATSAIAYHNHPSGDPTPSHEDTQLTNRLRSSGDSLGVTLSDHLVIGSESYHSFRVAQNWDR